MWHSIPDHAKTDPNASKHMRLGVCGSFIISGIAFFSLLIIDTTFDAIIVGIIMFILGGFITGIAIELVQRIQRIGKQQNSLRESILDALVTGCWPLMLIL